MVADLFETEWVILKVLNELDAQPVPGKIHLQKMIFLILQNTPQLLDLADFKPHKLGPYSEQIKHLLEELETSGLVKLQGKQITITPLGIEALEKYEELLPEREKVEKFREKVDVIKEDLSEFTVNELLAFIYKSFREYISDSVVADKLDYEALFLNLYKEKKLGMKKIAELMKWDLTDFYEIIKKRGEKLVLL